VVFRPPWWIADNWLQDVGEFQLAFAASRLRSFGRLANLPRLRHKALNLEATGDIRRPDSALIPRLECQAGFISGGFESAGLLNWSDVRTPE
jgi:hypothetical protein